MNRAGAGKESATPKSFSSSGSHLKFQSPMGGINNPLLSFPKGVSMKPREKYSNRNVNKHSK